MSAGRCTARACVYLYYRVSDRSWRRRGVINTLRPTAVAATHHRQWRLRASRVTVFRRIVYVYVVFSLFLVVNFFLDVRRFRRREPPGPEDHASHETTTATGTRRGYLLPRRRTVFRCSTARGEKETKRSQNRFSPLKRDHKPFWII